MTNNLPGSLGENGMLETLASSLQGDLHALAIFLHMIPSEGKLMTPAGIGQLLLLQVSITTTEINFGLTDGNYEVGEPITPVQLATTVDHLFEPIEAAQQYFVHKPPIFKATLEMRIVKKGVLSTTNPFGS